MHLLGHFAPRRWHHLSHPPTLLPLVPSAAQFPHLVVCAALAVEIMPMSDLMAHGSCWNPSGGEL